MARFEDLPVELILSIAQLLGDLDDPLHLARTCKTIYEALDDPRNRFTVSRAIILNAAHHRFEPQLSCLCEFYMDHVEDYVDETQLTVPRRTDTESIQKLLYPSEKILDSESVVEDIVLRWHSMKLLFDLYCNKSVEVCYRQGEFYWPEAEAAERLGPTPGAGENREDFRQLSNEEKVHSYQRFYQALTAQWIGIEFYWVLYLCPYKDQDERRLFFRRFRELRSSKDFHSLQEKMDLHEIIDFVWKFLVESIFQTRRPLWIFESRGPQSVFASSSPKSPYYLEWFDSIEHPFKGRREPCVFNWLRSVGLRHEDDEADILHEMERPGDVEWVSDSFADQLQSHLRPTHIIELLLLLRWNPEQSWKPDKFEYLRKLGFFERFSNPRPDQFYLHDNYIEVDTPPSFYIGHLWMEMQLSMVSEITDWGLFDKVKAALERRHFYDFPSFYWQPYTRGYVFLRDETAKELSERLVEILQVQQSTPSTPPMYIRPLGDLAELP